MKSTILTTYLLIIPFVSSIYFGIYPHALLVLLSLIFSLKYHGPSGKKWEAPDSIFATAVFIYNLYLLFLLRSNLGFAIPILLITLFSFIFKSLEKKNYEARHSAWHLCVITGTFLCSIGYGLMN